jgi:hypothetical protein
MSLIDTTALFFVFAPAIIRLSQAHRTDVGATAYTCIIISITSPMNTSASHNISSYLLLYYICSLILFFKAVNAYSKLYQNNCKQDLALSGPRQV